MHGRARPQHGVRLLLRSAVPAAELAWFWRAAVLQQGPRGQRWWLVVPSGRDDASAWLRLTPVCDVLCGVCGDEMLKDSVSFP